MSKIKSLVFGGLNELIGALDSLTIFALLMIGLGVAIASAPDQGAAAVLGQWGISSKGFGLILTFDGALIIRFGRFRVFAMLTLPYVFYLAALMQYIVNTTNSFAPIVVYTGCYVLALRLVHETTGKGGGHGR